MKWATIDTAEDNALYGAYRRDYVKLSRARRRELHWLKHMKKGGREKKQVARHEEFHGHILADYFGTLAISADGVVLPTA